VSLVLLVVLATGFVGVSRAWAVWFRDASGSVVKTLTAAAPYATNHRVSLAWAKCTLAKGKYTYAVYAYDQAGHAQIRTASARFGVE
jgi:hypothetical protein